MRLGQPQLPRKARAVYRGERGRARAALAAGDENHLCAGLGHAGRDRAHAAGGHQLDRQIGRRIDALEIVNQLRQILDGVDVVMRGRGDQRQAGRGAAGFRHFFGDLCAGQMAALAGLCALRHFDLYFLGRAQIGRGHAEAAGGHLLDRRVALRAEAFGQLAALAGVRFAAQPVHRRGQTLVRLAGKRAIGHRAGLEAMDDARSGLDLIERHRRARVKAEIEQRADGARAVVFDERRVLFKQRGIVVPERLLKRVDDLRGVKMLLGILPCAQLVEAHAVGRGVGRSVGALVMPERLALDVLKPHAAQVMRRVGEIAVDEIGVQPDCLEELRALIRAERGHAHLGGNVQYARRERV